MSTSPSTDDMVEFRKSAFLDALELHGTVTEACEAIGVTPATVYKWRKLDDEFRKAWIERVEPLVFMLEDEAVRRALHGCESGIYHLGRRIGSRREFSDTLLLALLKAHMPEKYRDRSEVKHTTDLAERILRARDRVGDTSSDG